MNFTIPIQLEPLLKTLVVVFDVSFDILFELEVTSGPLSGLIVETMDPAAFEAMDLELPWQDGATFISPDPVDLFVKFDPTGTFQPGTFVGTSFDRSVINNSVVVPEPSIGFLGFFLLTAITGRRRRPNCERVVLFRQQP